MKFCICFILKHCEESSQSLRNCWRIVSVTDEQSCQRQLNNRVIFLVHGTILEQWLALWKNRASKEKRKIILITEKLCHWLLKNCTSDCWAVVLVTVEESWQRLLKSYTSKCWRIVPMTLEQSCQRMLNNYARDC